ncbi:hypothetical protein FFF34_010200 [Inquilinus sp. KBS0705]|nr:hypothetical protein FFF34_010200 [Inquilinus sp. KBS0705]
MVSRGFIRQALIAFACFIMVGFVFFTVKLSVDKTALPKFQAVYEPFKLASAPIIAPIKINFQDSTTQAPPGWLQDVGEPFGSRSSTFQGSEVMYGWKSTETRQPISLKGNGRARIEPEDVLLSTFIHMQANNINTIRYGKFSGVRAQGYWELKVLNGVYKVSVAVGDGAVTQAPEMDCINIEGVSAVSNFTPIGKTRSMGRFKTTNVTVTVSDGYLTIDANGGTNTKICYAEVVPVAISPYVYMLTENQNLLVTKNEEGPAACNIRLHNSTGSVIKYDISVNLDSHSPAWLKIPAKVAPGDSILTVDYSAAAKLPVGTYSAKIKATAAGFTSTEMDLQVRVVDGSKPYIIASTPVNGSCILNSVTIAANNLFIPAVKGYKGGTNNATISNKTVKLLKIHEGREIAVPGAVQGTGGGDAISFSPSQPLEPNTHYKFVITSGVKSYAGVPFIPFQTSFSTAAKAIDSSNFIDARFTKISIPGTQNKKYTSLTFGPDGRFYALKIDGGIERYNVDHVSGMLSGMYPINTLIKKRGESTAIGLTFDPSSTKQNLVAWVSYSSAGLSEAPMFDGKVSKLFGPNLEQEQQAIINLPRSTRDHMVNSMAFGPDKALYISVGSNSSAGTYDKGWQREETLLAGSILRLDLNKLAKCKLPLNVKTTADQALINKASRSSMWMRDGTYNPYSLSSPLTIYASGIRNGYDMVWHSNGQLYVPANGSGGGGNSPQSIKGTRRANGSYYNGPEVMASESVPVQRDWLFRINPERSIGYYGHPNPLRGEYVINRGYTDNPSYQANVKPDANYRGAAFDFGFNKSPNGVIEYKSNAFNGVLKGKLLVCRFSGGGDIMVLEPGTLTKVKLKDVNDDHVYDIVRSAAGASNYGLEGMVGFANPLDITEDVLNGNLYVSEFNWNENPNLISQITLLKVIPETPKQQLAKIRSVRVK